MNRPICNTLLAICLLLLSVPTLADHRPLRVLPHAAEETGWRLSHERLQNGFAIYRRQGHAWYRMPGAAIAVADGWVLGSQREDGGFAIFRWNGHGWDQAPGAAVRIGGSYRQPWVINDRGQHFEWDGYDWRPSHQARRPDQLYSRR